MALQTPSPPFQDVAGLVLAGGRSIRFGGEKAAALFGGQPLVLRAAGRLAAACAPVAINARPGSEAERLAGTLPVLHDRPGDPEGPLAGIRAGLAWARGQGAAGLAVIPCDAPVTPDDLVTRLIARAGNGAAMAETEDGAEPLFAVWPTRRPGGCCMTWAPRGCAFRPQTSSTSILAKSLRRWRRGSAKAAKRQPRKTG